MDRCNLINNLIQFINLAPEFIGKEIFNITFLLNTIIEVEEPHTRR